MANVKFTRDEVILLLDVAYSSTRERMYSETSTEVVELSAVLQKLPIHPVEKRPENFRNFAGIRNQLNNFVRGHSDIANNNVGALFYQIDVEYPDKQELHNVAKAIRRNLPYYNSTFGDVSETDNFPEGVLLGHLHRLLEQRDSLRLPLEERCCICQLKPDLLYKPCSPLLQHHLTVPPAEMDGGKKYEANDFMTVCPNCHAALHRVRPWLTKRNCGELLR